MKNTTKILHLLLIAFFLCLSTLTSCSKKEEEATPVQTTKDLAELLEQTLPVLDGTTKLVLHKAGNEYSLVMSKIKQVNKKGVGDSTTNLLDDEDGGTSLVCQGTGISFARCCQSHLDNGETLTVKKCGDKYCAYA